MINTNKKEKKGMFKEKSIYSFAALVFLVCFFFGCNTTTPNRGGITKYEKDATRNYEQIKKGGYVDIAPYTLRDFEIKGLVFVESKVTIDVNGERNGSEITNYMLMKEAQKLGADDVINVKIDEKEESEVIDTYDSKLKFLKRKYKKTSYIYHATALAIKYTNAIYGDKTNVKGKNEITINPAKNIEKQIEKQEEPIKQEKTIKQQTKLKK